LLWIKHNLSNRQQRVIVDGNSSYPSKVISGYPQGTVLAPLLFYFSFVNDIPLNVTSMIRLYADDILLYHRITSHEECTLLQNDIDNVIKWSKTWQLLFNFDKCDFLINSPPYLPPTCTTSNAIKQVSSVKYLGIAINEKLHWSEHIITSTLKIKNFQLE